LVEWLDFASSKWVDVVELLEMFNGKRISNPEPINGPATQLLASKVKQWKMYVGGAFYKRQGYIVYNTTVFFDSKGELVGIYEELELYDPELDEGDTPGIQSQVFKRISVR